MDEVEDFPEENSVEVPDQRWHWSFLLMHTVGLGANVAQAVSSYLMDVATDIGAHANRQIEFDRRADFRDQAAEEIDAFLQEG